MTGALLSQGGHRFRELERHFVVIPRHTVARFSYHGIPLNGCQRFPTAVSHQDFDSVDHIIAVKEAGHRPLIQARFSTWLDRVEFWEVHDVDYAAPDEAIPQLESEIIGLIERLANSL